METNISHLLNGKFQLSPPPIVVHLWFVLGVCEVYTGGDTLMSDSKLKFPFFNSFNFSFHPYVGEVRGQSTCWAEFVVTLCRVVILEWWLVFAAYPFLCPQFHWGQIDFHSVRTDRHTAPQTQDRLPSPFSSAAKPWFNHWSWISIWNQNKTDSDSYSEPAVFSEDLCLLFLCMYITLWRTPDCKEFVNHGVRWTLLIPKWIV